MTANSETNLHHKQTIELFPRKECKEYCCNHCFDGICLNQSNEPDCLILEKERNKNLLKK